MAYSRLREFHVCGESIKDGKRSNHARRNSADSPKTRGCKHFPLNVSFVIASIASNGISSDSQLDEIGFVNYVSRNLSSIGLIVPLRKKK